MKRLIKFWLVLGVFLSSIISFGYCFDFVTHSDWISRTVSSQGTYTVYSGHCVRMDSQSANRNLEFYDMEGNLVLGKVTNATAITNFCFSQDGYIKNTSSSSTVYDTNVGFYPTICPVCQECQECPSCQENTCVLTVNQNGIDDDYNCVGDCNFDLYLEDDVVYTGYNNPGGSTYLTMAGICSYTGVETSGDWSALYINDIQHLGAGIINVTIPAEIEWDYIYTGNGEQFDLNVKGYNVDTDYIEGIINTQNSKPNKVDFNNTITGLLPIFVPGLVIILLLYFIFRFIKKIF